MKKFILLVLIVTVFQNLVFADTCVEPKICNTYIACKAHLATFTWAAFTTWVEGKTNLNDIYAVYTTSSNIKILYQDSCKAQEICYDSNGECTK